MWPSSVSWLQCVAIERQLAAMCGHPSSIRIIFHPSSITLSLFQLGAICDGEQQQERKRSSWEECQQFLHKHDKHSIAPILLTKRRPCFIRPHPLRKGSKDSLLRSIAAAESTVPWLEGKHVSTVHKRRCRCTARPAGFATTRQTQRKLVSSVLKKSFSWYLTQKRWGFSTCRQTHCPATPLQCVVCICGAIHQAASCIFRG